MNERTRNYTRMGAASAAIIGALALAACGGSGSSESTTTSTASGGASTPAASPATSTASSSSAGAPEGGEAIFKQDCGGCHHAGSVGKGRIALDHIGSQHDARWLKVQIRTPEQHHSRMPAFGASRLSDKDLSTLITYLLSQK